MSVEAGLAAAEGRCSTHDWLDSRMVVKAYRLCQSTGFAALLASLALLSSGCNDAESELAVESLELQDVAAYWAVRGKDREENNYIHPVIRFRLHNGGATEVGYIQVMAVFKRESFPDEPWGNDFLYSVGDAPLPPGGASDLLTLRSDTNFISKDAPEQMFQNEKWEQVRAGIFLRVGSSSWKPALEIDVPKQIGAPGLERFLEPSAESDKAALPQ